MKALSAHQPWASMIASGSKTIETRTWSTNYRGDLLICSTRSPKIMGLPSGKALCFANLIDCRPMTRDDEPAARCQLFDGAFAWVLAEIRQVIPFRVRGQQGLYNIDLPEGYDR